LKIKLTVKVIVKKLRKILIQKQKIKKKENGKTSEYASLKLQINTKMTDQTKVRAQDTKSRTSSTLIQTSTKALRTTTTTTLNKSKFRYLSFKNTFYNNFLNIRWIFNS